jgi:GTP-binding protein HflX
MTTEPRAKAVLVGLQLPEVTDAEHHANLDELARLCDTWGLEVVGRVSQRREGLGSATVLGTGKLKELAEWTGGSGIVEPYRKKPLAEEEDDEDDAPPELDEEGEPVPVGPPRATVVVVDHEMSPQQLRNLQKATGAEVMDRAGVIIEIFHRHASSREARLQVEIARLKYLAPRLRETGGGQRQKGGIGQKGAGESSVELDRRRIRDRVAELRAELATIDDEAKVRRSRRKEALRVALVGYTNAGKSSLMRALTGSSVLVADRLFATLDTTVRALYPESRPRVLVSDTVGFIKKLPHDLVASFRSTLDEALEASLLLHVVDAADPGWPEQRDVTRQVLDEIGADDVPRLLVLNKADRLSEEERAALRAAYPDALLVSSRDPDDVARVREVILDRFREGMEEVELHVPYGVTGVIGEIQAQQVLEEEYLDDGVRFRIRASRAAIERIRSRMGAGPVAQSSDD